MEKPNAIRKLGLCDGAEHWGAAAEHAGVRSFDADAATATN
ncbi:MULTISPECIES: hypothetical protein [unclassified Bosea (in: a-proteobacteria)]|nr:MULTISPECIES: hypothetical protein [unclassified Bosea (in: a-proteobacteria)]